MVVMVLATAERLRQILQVGELTALGSVGEVGRELGELARCAGVTLRLGRLSGAQQVGGDLLGHLRVFCWIRLLKLLQRVDQLRKWRKVTAVGLRPHAAGATYVARNAALESAGLRLQ
jgi:hypothetical protein